MRLGTCLLYEGHSIQGARTKMAYFCSAPMEGFYAAVDKSACGLAYLQMEDYENAVFWAEKGARAPGPHFLIGAIASMICEISGDEEKAVYWATKTKERRPDASVAMFFSAFPFEDTQLRSQIASALVSVGFQTD